jgi:D-3-phosphoglycerate dehydrogenase
MTPVDRRLSIYLGPAHDPAIVAGLWGLPVDLVDLPDAEVVIWLGSSPLELQRGLSASNKWVQLRSAGIEAFIAADVVDTNRIWTSAAGAYAQAVSEHAVALLLAGVRGIAEISRWSTWRREDAFPMVGSLGGSTVAVIGTGGIGRAIINRLRSFEVEIVAVNRSGNPVEDAARTVQVDELASVIDDVDHLVLAIPETTRSRGLIGRDLLARLTPASWVVNVGRGGAIDEDELLACLRSGAIGGAALDVTREEPLPDGHPFWSMHNVIVTPHVANTPTALEQHFIERIRENVRRYLVGDPLLGVVDPTKGY